MISLILTVAALVSFPLNDDLTLESRLDAYLAPFVEMGAFRGAVLIGRGDDIVLVKGYGMADLDHNIPNTPETRFPLGSIGKQLTAVAIMQLAEEGKLKLDEKIDRFFPKYRYAREITIHHLLTHGSGIPDLAETTPYRAGVSTDVSNTSEERIELLNKQRLMFKPGSDYRYTNIAYWLLAEIVEKASGTDHDAYMRQHIFAPAGMDGAVIDRGLPMPGMSIGYIQSHRGPLKYHYFERPIIGLIYMPPRDLFRFARGVATAKLISPASRDRMFTAQNQNYGYAWFIVEQPVGKMVWHGGNSIGYRAQVACHLYNDLTVVIFTNTFTTPFRDIINSVTRIAAGQPVPTPQSRTFVDIDIATLAPLLGSYKDEEGTIAEFGASPTGLYMDVMFRAGNLGANLRNRYLLFPLGGDRFYSMDHDAEVIFIREGDDRPQKLQFIDAGGPSEMRRFRDHRPEPFGPAERQRDDRDDDFERP